MNVIAEITDDMFEIEPIPFNNPKVRYGARGIVKTQDGLIAVFFKKAKNEYKLPGGGIEQGETPEEALEDGVIAGAVVANCNPFTLGHRYLIEEALKKCDYLNRC